MNIKKMICAVTVSAMMLGVVPVNLSSELCSSISITAEAASLSAPTGLKASVNGSKVTLSWNKVKDADGYRIYSYDSAKKAFVRLKTVSDTKTTVSGLSEGKHYFKVCAVEKVNGKYRAGSATKKVAVTVKKTDTVTDKTSSAVTTPAAESSVRVAKEMGKGWNLGNTMESVANWLGNNPKPEDFEKAWGQPVTTKKMITEVKKAGFDSVRIPVAWSNMMSTDGKYTISESYFKRVDEIIGYVLDNDMYCVVNIHWDGGWWEDFGSQSANTRNEAMKKYKAMWTQIAKHYADYSDKLIFESANEELGNATQGNASTEESYKRVNNINQTFVDIVRSTGGKNKTRYLLIAGYNTDIDRTVDSRYKMPSDSAKGKLLVSVHYYTPSNFCIADKSDNSWGYKGSWGTKSDIEAMERDFRKLEKFTKAGYGVIIGEYGVTHCNDNGKRVKKEGTDLFFKYVNEFAEKYGCCAMLWDCSDWFVRSSCSFQYSDVEKVFRR